MIRTMHDVIRYMKRFPDNIIHKDSSKQMTAKTWQCSRCKTKYHSEIDRELPSSCKMCGGIRFEKVD